MTQKDKNTLGNLLGLAATVLGIYFWMKTNLGGAVGFFVIFIITATVPHILISSIIPTKSNKKSKNTNTAQKNKTTSQKTTANKKNPTSNTPKKEHNLLRSEKEILTLPLDFLTWREFERLCFLYYKAKGYKPRETSEGADGGVDLIIYNKYHKTDVAIQIKHYSNPVTVEHIRQLDSAKKNHKCMLAEFITTSTYTQAAAREASDRKIEYRDRMWVENKILKWRDEEVQKRNFA